MSRAPLLAIVLLLTLAPAALACPPVRRSAAVGRAFQRTHPCPSTGQTTGACPGWIRDHIQALCLTGPAGDIVENLQWQSTAAAKQKDRLERRLCRLQPRPCPHQGD